MATRRLAVGFTDEPGVRASGKVVAARREPYEVVFSAMGSSPCRIG